MTSEQQIQDYAKRTLSPTERENWRTVRTQRILAKLVLDNPVAWGRPFVFVGD
jgi:hypothetical protein